MNQYQACLYLSKSFFHCGSKYGHEISKCWDFLPAKFVIFLTGRLHSSAVWKALVAFTHAVVAWAHKETPERFTHNKKLVHDDVITPAVISSKQSRYAISQLATVRLNREPWGGQILNILSLVPSYHLWVWKPSRYHATRHGV